MSQIIKTVLNMMGYSAEQFAQEAAQRGFGEAQKIYQALQRGDVSMFNGYAQQLAQNQPQMAELAKNRLASMK